MFQPPTPPYTCTINSGSKCKNSLVISTTSITQQTQTNVGTPFSCALQDEKMEDISRCDKKLNRVNVIKFVCQLHQSFFTTSCHILVSLTNRLLDFSVDTLQFIQLKSFQLALAFISGNVHIQISEVQSPPGNLKGLTTDMKWSNRGESNIIRSYRIS